VAEPQPQPQPQGSSPEARAAAIAAVLAGSAAAGAAATAPAGAALLTADVLSKLTRLFLLFGYRRATVRHALRVVTRVVRVAGPDGTSPPSGPAQLATDRSARTFVAWFLERTTARVEAGYAAGAAEGEPEAREERFIEQHLDAQDRRHAAARAVDAEAQKPGHVTDERAGGRVILRWRAHPDDKVTPECRAADGAWFYADTPPVIGYPGMPHGGTCRCWPAHAGSLAEVARGRHVNEAVRAIIVTTPDHRPHPASIPA
jgi:hypothetical protein